MAAHTQAWVQQEASIVPLDHPVSRKWSLDIALGVDVSPHWFLTPLQSKLTTWRQWTGLSSDQDILASGLY